MTVFDLESGFMLVVELVLLAVKVFAFVNSLLWSAESYTAAGKLTKPAWTIILGLGLAVQVAAARRADRPAQPGLHDRGVRLPRRRAPALSSLTRRR